MNGDIAPRGRLFSKEEFLEILDDLRSWIENGDSMEGSLAYETAWGKEDEPGSFRVQGALRFGTSMGQGSVRVLTDPHAPMPEDPS